MFDIQARFIAPKRARDGSGYAAQWMPCFLCLRAGSEEPRRHRSKLYKNRQTQAAFERTARRARLGVAASNLLHLLQRREGRPLVSPFHRAKRRPERRRGAQQRAGRMAGRKRLKINKRPAPRRSRGAGRRQIRHHVRPSASGMRPTAAPRTPAPGRPENHPKCCFQYFWSG